MAEEYIHTGGWAIVHRYLFVLCSDNTLEINLMDAVEKKEVRADLIDKVDIKDQDTVTGKYIAKVRKAASKSIAKRLT